MGVDNGGGVERLRVRVAVVITVVWVLSFFASLLLHLDSGAFAGAQAMMLIVAGWLFAAPALRRNGNGNGNGNGKGEP